MPSGNNAPAGDKKYILMTKINDYEVYLNELGITSEEESDTILGFIRELFAIAIQHFNNERETVEDCL